MMRRNVNAKCVAHFANILGMNEFDTSAKRLKWARENLSPYKKPIEACTAFGWKPSTYYGHEDGRALPADAAKRYAPAYKVDWLWLFDGTGKAPWETTTTAELLSTTREGRRLENIRQALKSDLPARLGITDEVVWSALINQPGGIHPRIAERTAEITGLPLGYVKDGELAGVTPDRLAALLRAFLEEDPPNPKEAGAPVRESAAIRGGRTAGRKRS